MVNFGYPYNDLVICKDSTDYLGLGLGLAGFRVRFRFRFWVMFRVRIRPLGLGFHVTNSDRRVTVGDRVIFTNHIPVLAEGLRN